MWTLKTLDTDNMRLRAWEIETHDSVVGLAEDFGREAAGKISQFTLFFVKFYTFLSTLENILRSES